MILLCLLVINVQKFFIQQKQFNQLSNSIRVFLYFENFYVDFRIINFINFFYFQRN